MAESTEPHAILELDGEADTVRLAERLASMTGPGDMIALTGDLGTGKTVLARALIRARTRPDEEVPSPTFTLVQVYETDAEPAYHFDLYRIEDTEEIYELGFEEALSDGVVLVEWPDRLGTLLPSDRLDVELQQGAGPDRRIARLTGRGYWIARMTDAFSEGAIHG